MNAISISIWFAVAEQTRHRVASSLRREAPAIPRSRPKRMFQHCRVIMRPVLCCIRLLVSSIGRWSSGRCWRRHTDYYSASIINKCLKSGDFCEGSWRTVALVCIYKVRRYPADHLTLGCAIDSEEISFMHAIRSTESSESFEVIGRMESYPQKNRRTHYFARCNV